MDYRIAWLISHFVWVNYKNVCFKSRFNYTLKRSYFNNSETKRSYMMPKEFKAVAVKGWTVYNSASERREP